MFHHQGMGRLKFCKLRKHGISMKFYQHIMSTALAEIRARDVWHIVMAWHFYAHTSVSSESLAEAAGSYFAVTRRHNINGILSIIVRSSKLRALGLKGLGRGIWNHGLCSEYTFSVLRARRIAFSCETCKAKHHDRCSDAQRSPIVE